MEKLILCDLDGTILDNLKRKQQCIREASGKSVGLEELSKNYEINRFLTMGEFGRFSKVFFSNKYLALDTPVPGAAKALKQLLDRDYSIIYLTGRHEDMRSGTLDWLERHGFPGPGTPRVEILMKPDPEQRDEEFKREVMPSIRGMGFAIAGIGDLPLDALTYSRLGAVPLIFRRPYNEGERTPPGTVMMENWHEVLEWVERNG